MHKLPFKPVVAFLVCSDYCMVTRVVHVMLTEEFKWVGARGLNPSIAVAVPPAVTDSCEELGVETSDIFLLYAHLR